MRTTNEGYTKPKQPRSSGGVLKKAMIPTFCFAVLSTAAFQETIFAEQNNITQYVNVDSGSLNLRKGASTNSAVIGKLAKGTAVTVYSQANGWAKVKASGKIGFVSFKFLSPKESINFSKQTISNTVTKYVNISGGTLNLRKSPSTKSAVIGSLKKGTAVTIYSEANGWAKVKAGGKTGYVSASFLSPKTNGSFTQQSVTATQTKYVNVDSGTLNLRKSASTNSAVIGSLKKGTAVTVYSEAKGWAKVKAGSKAGYVSTAFLSTNANDSFTQQSVTAAKTKYVNIDSGSLNMRNSASITASIIIKLAQGTAVKVYSISGGWAKIQVYGKTGFVSSAFLSDKPKKASSNSTTVQKTTTKYVNIDPGYRLNVRKSASTSAAIVTKLTNGTAVKVFQETKGWAKIEVNRKQGFVSSSFLVSKKVTPTTPKKTPTVTKYVNVNLGSSLNMRKSASTSASVLLKLARGIQVTVYSEAKGWAKIGAYGKIGYVSSNFLSATKLASGTNTGSGSAPSTNNGNNSQVVVKYVDVEYGASLRMRAQASTNAEIITQLARGTMVTIISEKDGWTKVTVNGKTGYVSSQFLSKTAPFNPNTTSGSIKKVYENYNITLAEMSKIQTTVNPQTDKKYKTYIRSDALTLTSPTSGTVNGTGWNVRGGAGQKYWTIGQVKDKEKLQILATVKGEDGYDWYKVTYNKTWVNASPEDIAYYLNPNNFLGTTANSLQFLKLSVTTNLNANEVNQRVLSGKGVLQGTAATFISAGEKYGVNEMYLISHALLETNNGKSELAKGIKVNGKTVYNMYGVGAYDADAINSGAQFAYNAGWFTPEAAIIGGAQFIANGYINAGQDTLYKMRWNPGRAVATGKATHQYASDIGWAAKQVTQMYNLYSLVDSYKLVLEIPKYK